MPPASPAPQDTIRWLTTILAALAKKNGGELRVPRKAIRQVSDESLRQVLLEDLDSAKDEIVLRFGSKHSAIYPVEPECKIQPTPQPQPQPVVTRKPNAQIPMTDEQIARAERRLNQMKTMNAIKRSPTTSEIPL